MPGVTFSDVVEYIPEIEVWSEPESSLEDDDGQEYDEEDGEFLMQDDDHDEALLRSDFEGNDPFSEIDFGMMNSSFDESGEVFFDSVDDMR